MATRARVEIERPDGTRVTFEGPVEACERLVERHIRPRLPRQSAGAARPARKTRDVPATRLKQMRHVFERALPSNDSERIALIVALAERWGQTPVDAGYVSDWFERLGLRQPTYMRSALSNARLAGFVAPERRGSFVPTGQALAFTDGVESAKVVSLAGRRT